MKRVQVRNLRALRAMVEKGEWRDALAFDAVNDVAALDERALPLALTAALELGDDATVARLIDDALRLPATPETKLEMARRLINWRRSDDGWRLLETVETCKNEGQLAALCHRVSLKTSEPVVRAAAKAKFQGLVGTRAPDENQPEDALGPQANLAEFEFPPPSSADTPAPTFSMRIDRNAEVAPEHVDEFARLMKKFEARLAMRLQPSVHRFDNVLVNRLGQIWRPDGEIIVSKNRPLLRREPKPDMPRFKRAALNTNGTRGFYHWYAERAPALAWHIAAGAEVVTLFGDHAARFQDETMSLLGFGPQDFARIGDVAHCETVYVAQLELSCLADWPRFASVYDTLGANAERAGPAASDADGESPLIYISRRDTDRRRMLNEEELEARLAALGVRSVLLGQLPLAEQIRLVRRARVIIGSHGAGLTHLLNARAGAKVLEIMPTQPGFHSIRFNFTRLSRLRGHRHTLLLEPFNAVARTWRVDVDRVCAAAERLMTTS